MSSSSSSAQNLDLAALGDALGASNDDKAKGKGSGGDSPATLSPNSVGSRSPTSTQPPKQALSPSASPAPAPAPTPASKPAVSSKVSPSTDSNDAELQAKVRAVKGMFPHLDSDTVAAVLAAENGDEEAAVNVLLSMTPGNNDAPPPRSEHMSADEALARSLALEEDEAYARETQAREDQRRSAGRRNQQQPPPMPPRQSGRGGGGAASFFSDLKQSVQPLFDGKGPLARDSQGLQYQGQGGSRGAPSYDASQLTYQPRVRKTPAARGGAPQAPQQHQAQQQQQQQQPSMNASWSRYQPPTSATATPQNTQQQQQWRPAPQSQAPHQPIRLFGTPQTPTAAPRDTGKGREVLTGAGVGAGAGVAVGAATGAAAASSTAAPPASIASILEQGRRDATSPHSNDDDDDADADDVDSDELEYQKSPFDDED